MRKLERSAIRLDPQNAIASIGKQNAIILAKVNWCPHCVEFEPQFEEFAKQWPFTSAIVTVEKQPGDSDRLPEAKKFKTIFGINGWPTIILLRADRQWKKYDGPRTREAIEKEAKDYFA